MATTVETRWWVDPTGKPLVTTKTYVNGVLFAEVHPPADATEISETQYTAAVADYQALSVRISEAATRDAAAESVRRQEYTEAIIAQVAAATGVTVADLRYLLFGVGTPSFDPGVPFGGQLDFHDERQSGHIATIGA